MTLPIDACSLVLAAVPERNYGAMAVAGKPRPPLLEPAVPEAKLRVSCFQSFLYWEHSHDPEETLLDTIRQELR